MIVSGGGHGLKLSSARRASARPLRTVCATCCGAAGGGRRRRGGGGAAAAGAADAAAAGGAVLRATQASNSGWLTTLISIGMKAWFDAAQLRALAVEGADACRP